LIELSKLDSEARSLLESLSNLIRAGGREEEGTAANARHREEDS
jgi:hypothetical protein